MNLRNKQFWLALLILVIVIIASIGTYQRWWSLRLTIGPFSLSHWLVIIGSAYILILVPIYSYVKRHSKTFSKKLFNFHVFGNLTAFLLISMHFFQQASRTPAFSADQSTGIILYFIAAIMILTGFSQRFGIFKRLIKSWRFIHLSLTLSMYIIITAHVLQYLDIL